jgi:hypothetical protein
MQPVDSRPLLYELHTNRELEFMLHRGKPLAHFSDGYPSEPNEAIFPEKAFAPHVEAGELVIRDYVEVTGSPPPISHPHLRGTRHLFYARTGEAWRIDAFIEMLAASVRSGWSEGFERLEGRLLGYEEWQNDLHLDRLRTGPLAEKFYWLRKPSGGG